jgi:hypothetical protein
MEPLVKSIHKLNSIAQLSMMKVFATAVVQMAMSIAGIRGVSSALSLKPMPLNVQQLWPTKVW